MSIGAGALLFGPDFCRPLILPLLVLTFAIPLPGVLANHLLYPLELRDAKDVEWMLHTLGIPALREGTGLYLSGRTFAVIEACSGLRSIQVLTLLAVAWSSFFAVRLPHALVLILAAPLIAYGVNLLRILSLVLTPYPDVVSMHTAQGVLVFLAGLVVLYGVDDLLRRVWPVPEESPTPQASPRLERGHDRERTRRGLALAGLLLLMVGAPFALGPWRVDAPDQSSPIRLAKQLNGFEARQSTRVSPRLLGSVALGRSIDREYERDGEVVRVFVGWDDRSRRDRSLLSPLHALPGPEWEPEERTRLPAEAGHPSIEAILARSSAQRVLSYWWSAGRGGLPQEVLRASLATDQSFLRRPGGALVVRLSVDLQTVGDDRERGHELLREFLGLLRTSLVAPGS
jgi:exosortase/archaeosortase family protein